jgi:hypothetical protein
VGLSVHQIMLNKEVLPVVEALLQVWSTPRAHLLKDKYPCLNGFGTRHLDLGGYAKRHDLSKEREEKQRKLTVAIGLALEANPPARKTDSLVDFYEDSKTKLCFCKNNKRRIIMKGRSQLSRGLPSRTVCPRTLGVPMKCPMGEYGWDGEGKRLCAWFRTEPQPLCKTERVGDNGTGSVTN